MLLQRGKHELDVLSLLPRCEGGCFERHSAWRPWQEAHWLVRGYAFRFGAVRAALGACLFLSAGEEIFLSLIVPELLGCLEDLGAEGRRRVHHAL